MPTKIRTILTLLLSILIRVDPSKICSKVQVQQQLLCIIKTIIRTKTDMIKGIIQETIIITTVSNQDSIIKVLIISSNKTKEETKITTIIDDFNCSLN